MQTIKCRNEKKQTKTVNAKLLHQVQKIYNKKTIQINTIKSVYCVGYKIKKSVII